MDFSQQHDEITSWVLRPRGLVHPIHGQPHHKDAANGKSALLSASERLEMPWIEREGSAAPKPHDEDADNSTKVVKRTEDLAADMLTPLHHGITSEESENGQTKNESI